jgi:1,4-dihydroxy-2-naphthoyl-CoA hydrolase
MNNPAPAVAIWKWTLTPEQFLSNARGTLGGHLGIRLLEVGPDYLRGSLPVDTRTKQPYGRLHGGASVVLAEELGSMAANMCLDLNQAYAVGLDINANHLRGVFDGEVIGTAKPLHLGRSTQVWEIRIETGSGNLACIARLTMAVVAKHAPKAQPSKQEQG